MKYETEDKEIVWGVPLKGSLEKTFNLSGRINSYSCAITILIHDI